MKAASTELIALLNSRTQFVMADLYTFTLVGGNLLRYSAAPTAIVANGFSFAVGPKFERSKTSTVIGTQVDELDIKVYKSAMTNCVLEFSSAISSGEAAFMSAQR